MSRADFNALVSFAHSLAPVKVRGTELPRLWFLTDAARVADPVAVIARLPRGSGVIFRDYQAPGRAALAARLADVARTHDLVFLVAGDMDLARAVGAAGVHAPERDLDKIAGWRAAWPDAVITAAVHSAKVLPRAAGADGALVSPVFATQSHPDAATLGRAGLVALMEKSSLPVIALGGISAATVQDLQGLPLAGIAAIGALA